MIHAAAIMHIKTKTIYTLPIPARHCDIIHNICEKHGFKEVGAEFEQGFIASYDDVPTAFPLFVRRRTAKRLAIESNQILPGKGNNQDLFSEDVW